MHSPLRHVPSLFSKRRAIHLTFFVTRRCNARCSFCFYDAGGAPGVAPELSAEEVRRVAASLGDLLWVLFSGGEPFLRDDLVELSGIFHDANRAAFLTYPTNGFLPEVVVERTQEILRRCPESVVVVKLSLDGVGADHDRLRQVPGGFARLMSTYRRLRGLAAREPRLELGVNTLFCPENQSRLDAILDFVAGLDGIRSHTITMLRAPSRGGLPDVDLGRYRAASLRLEEGGTARRRFHRFAGSRLKAAQDRLQHQLIHRTLVERRRLVPCYAGRLALVLTETGDLHPCEGRFGDSFGNVRESGYDVRSMLRSARAQRILGAIAEGGCWCSHECNFLTNILFNPRMHPRLLHRYAQLRLGRARPVEGEREDDQRRARRSASDRDRRRLA